jgi:Domain of unknown function (DUF1906)
VSPPTLYEYADYSTGTISATALLAAGFKGSVRYITAPELMNPKGFLQKHMTRAEYEDHKAHGLDVIFVHQGSETDADSGFNGGVRSAQRALAGLKYLGAPLDSPVFLTNDRPTLPSASAWQQYLRGGRSVLGRIGQYGFRNAIDAGWDIADWRWQCGSESQLRAGVHMYQWNNGSRTVAGRTCDINRVFIPILSQPVAPPPQPYHSKDTDEMIISAPGRGQALVSGPIVVPLGPDSAGPVNSAANWPRFSLTDGEYDEYLAKAAKTLSIADKLDALKP